MDGRKESPPTMRTTITAAAIIAGAIGVAEPDWQFIGMLGGLAHLIYQTGRLTQRIDHLEATLKQLKDTK